MSLPRYHAYKPSGVEWFGEVPSHWQAKRLKNEASYCVSNVDKVPSDDELPVRLCNYTDVYYNDQITPDMELMETTATVEEIRKFGLRVNDVLITKDSEEWGDIAVPAMVAETAPDLVCGYHLAIIRPTEGRLHGKYLLRVLQSSAVNQQFQIAASGVTRYGLPKSSIGEAWLPLPPLEEQQTIADFLDAQTAKIDTLLAKKRQFIAKLKEKRSALIARTVTRGLPPAAAQAAGLEPHPAMKDSGVEWLGKTPAHWMATQLRRYITFITSGSRGWAEHYSDSGAVFVRIGNLTRDSLAVDLSDIQYVEPPAGAEGERTRIKAGDLLFSITAYLGSIAVASDDLAGAFVSQHIALTRLAADTFVPRYAGYYVLSDAGQSQLNEQGYGGTKVQLSLGDVKALWFPIPPKHEQQAIAAYLDHETARIDQLTAKVESAIARLTEYRQALITAAVTGKIDVRARTVG